MDIWGVALSANQCSSACVDNIQCNNVHEGLKNHYINVPNKIVISRKRLKIELNNVRAMPALHRIKQPA